MFSLKPLITFEHIYLLSFWIKQVDNIFWFYETSTVMNFVPRILLNY